MTVLIGFGAGVMDIGMLYQTRRQLQNGVDGAALAGAWELALGNGQLQAVNAALDYAQRNGISPDQMDPAYPQVSNEGPYTDNALVVAAGRRLNLLVAGLFANGVGDVRDQATAVVGPVLATEELWPWGVPQGDVATGQRVALEVHDPFSSGARNLRALDYPPNGGGGSVYRDQIQYGYGQGADDYVSPALPWDVPVDNGDMVGPAQQGVDYLVDMAASSGQDDISSPWNQPTPVCTWADAPQRPSDSDVLPPAGWVGNTSACYRIGIVSILQSYDTDGQGEVTITGWAPFYLIGYGTGAQGRKYVWGYFLEQATVSGGRLNWGGAMSGLIGVRLWR